MKKLRKLTRKQKDILTTNEFNSKDYLLERIDDKDRTYTFVHRDTKEVLVLSYIS